MAYDDLLDAVVAALEPLGIPIEVGEYLGMVSDERIIVSAPVTTFWEADNEPVCTDETVDVDLFLLGDYRAIARKARAALEAAGAPVDEEGYVERIKPKNLHHYRLTVERYDPARNDITEE